MIKNYKNVYLILSLATTTFAGYFWLIRQPVFQEIIGWAQENFLLLQFLLCLGATRRGKAKTIEEWREKSCKRQNKRVKVAQ